MQEVSSLFRSLWNDKYTSKEIKVVIAGEEYRHDRIFSAEISLEQFSEGTACAGSAAAREINLVLRDVGNIPKAAEMQVFLRLRNGGTVSEWLPKGVYYIDTREQQEGFDRLIIHGYDVIRKAEASFTSEGDQGEWPMIDLAAVKEIAERIGAKEIDGSRIDPRTLAALTSGYAVQYPGYGEGAYTMREVLGFVGAMYAGNWITNDYGQLRLLMLGDIPEETTLLIDENGDYIKLGSDRIYLVFGLEEPRRLVTEDGGGLLIGGDRILV